VVRIKDEISIYYPFNEYEETRKCESCHQNIPVKAKFCPHCKARKRKHANYPLITKLLIINIVLILLSMFVFKQITTFYLFGIFIGMLLSIYTIIHSIRGFYRNKPKLIIFSISSIVISHILFIVYLVLFFIPAYI